MRSRALRSSSLHVCDGRSFEVYHITRISQLAQVAEYCLKARHTGTPTRRSQCIIIIIIIIIIPTHCSQTLADFNHTGDMCAYVRITMAAYHVAYYFGPVTSPLVYLCIAYNI